MDFILDVLQIRHNREGHNNQQGPRTPLANMHNRPGSHLIWILPDTDKSTDVFSQAK